MGKGSVSLSCCYCGILLSIWSHCCMKCFFLVECSTQFDARPEGWRQWPIQGRGLWQFLDALPECLVYSPHPGSAILSFCRQGVYVNSLLKPSILLSEKGKDIHRKKVKMKILSLTLLIDMLMVNMCFSGFCFIFRRCIWRLLRIVNQVTFLFLFASDFTCL